MGEKRAQLEEEMEREARERREQDGDPDEDLPQSFQEMMMMAEGGQGTSVQQEPWDEKGEVEEPSSAAGSAAGEGGEEEEDGEWYDVKEQDDDDWTPQKPGQKVNGFQDLLAAENALLEARGSDANRGAQSEVSRNSVEAGFRAIEDEVVGRGNRERWSHGNVRPFTKTTMSRSDATSQESNNGRGEG